MSEEVVDPADVVPPVHHPSWRVSRTSSGRARLTVADEFDEVTVDLAPFDACRLAEVLLGLSRFTANDNRWTPEGME